MIPGSTLWLTTLQRVERGEVGSFRLYALYILLLLEKNLGDKAGRLNDLLPQILGFSSSSILHFDNLEHAAHSRTSMPFVISQRISNDLSET